MSNLFEEFSANDPEYLNMDLVETEVHRRLRSNFDSMTENYQIAIDMFRPAEDESNRIISLLPFEDELEDVEPKLQSVLVNKMLKTLNLEAPESYNDYRYVYRKPGVNGCEFIFTIDRQDGTYLPVYTRVNPEGVVMSVKLYTFASVSQVLNAQDYTEELIDKMNVTKKDLKPLSFEQLEGFYNDFDTIIHLPTVEE